MMTLSVKPKKDALSQDSVLTKPIIFAKMGRLSFRSAVSPREVFTLFAICCLAMLDLLPCHYGWKFS